MNMSSALDQPGFAAMRIAMVSSQLRTNAVNDPRVVRAMGEVARETFVPAVSRALAYRDTSVPLARGRALNPPLATGRLLTEAYLNPADRVLLIGAATGYTAAVLAELVRAVVAVESDPGMADAAAAALAHLPTVTVVQGPLERGCVQEGPYDVLIVDGAVEELPAALVDQLHPGGRIATGLNDRGVTRLAAGRRTEGGFGLVDFVDAECVPLPGFARPRAFQFAR